MNFITKIKTKAKGSLAVKVTMAVALTAIFTTSVFAATGLLNTNSVSTEELQAAIEEKVTLQLESRIKELLDAEETTSEIENKVTEKLNQDEIIAKLRAEIAAKLADTTVDLEIDEDELNNLIDSTVSSLMDTMVQEVIDSSIDEALLNYDINSDVSVEDYLAEKVEEQVKAQINKIIADNLDTVVEEAINSALDEALKDATITIKPSEDKPNEETPEDTSTYVTLDINEEEGTVTIDPASSYNGKTLEEFLVDHKDILSLDAEESTYGLYINNIGNILPEGYLAKKEGNKLVQYEYYIAYSINGEYASVGISSETIDDTDVYKFYFDSYSTGTTLAEVTVYAEGETVPYHAAIWGMKQSTEFASFVLDVYKDIDGLNLEEGQKVQDVIEALGIDIQVSGTGYSKIAYGDKVIQQSDIVSGRRAFVPTVYTVKVNGETVTLGYAKGVHEVKTSVEVVANGSTGKYLIANEWDGNTAKADATFSE